MECRNMERNRNSQAAYPKNRRFKSGGIPEMLRRSIIWDPVLLKQTGSQITPLRAVSGMPQFLNDLIGLGVTRNQGLIFNGQALTKL
jgi:hypothetical protein